MSDEDRRERSRGPFGPMERLDEVQRRAVEAAMRVASQFADSAGELADEPWFGAADGAEGSAPDAAARLDVGRMRGDVARAAETFVELMRSVMDVGFDALDELARRPVPQPTGRAAPGEIAHVSCTVRNDRAEPLRGARPLVHGLVSGVGDLLDAVVTPVPALLDLDAHERAHVDVEVHVSPIAPPGHYHGLVLVSGLPDVAIPIRFVVVDPEHAP
jgi:hypothetical protein